MYAIDKFYTDAKKAIHRSHDLQELQQLFLPFTKEFGEAGNSLFQYWATIYGDNPEEHLDWLTDVLNLLDGSIDKRPCFTNDDWKEIREAISINAEDIDIDILTSIMQVIMQYYGLD